jgi:phospholipase C
MALTDIKTFVVVMLENRSFDHVCGFLSLQNADPPMQVEGLRDDLAWLRQFDNDDHDGTAKQIHRLDPSVQNITDPPHEDNNIHTQITTPTHGNASATMGGFVKSYWDASPQPPDRSLVMGYYDKRAVPVFDFFAHNFAICDHWFSPLPAGTQTNRLMAMSGESQIHHNVSDPLDFPNQRLVYDWLDEVRGGNNWCSYQWEGLPFFSMMPSWWPRITAGLNDPTGLGEFRRYDEFKDQWQNNSDAIPDVVFIEPKYTDDPTFSFRPRNDDHCPTGITEGQKFLADIYNTIISNDDLWKSTMLIVTYDEHGGFFDHVTPPSVPAQAGGVNFSTVGVRVPAFVISPYVKPGSVYSDTVDSTSILQLLTDRFTPGRVYSPAVAARQKYFQRLSRILDNPPVTTKPSPIPAPTLDQLLSGSPAVALDTGEATPTAQALIRASSAMAKLHPDQIRRAKTGAA